MNVAPVAPMPTLARAADAPSAAAAAFGDLLATTPAAAGAPVVVAGQAGPMPVAAAPAAPANEPAPAQPVAIKAPVADHLPTLPTPPRDGSGAQPEPALVPTDPSQQTETATAAAPIVAPPASAPAPAPAVAAAPAPTPAAMADELATHGLPWQPIVTDNAPVPKLTTGGGDGHDAPEAGKPKSAKADPATVAPSDPRQPQPVMLTATPVATAIPQPIAVPASRQGNDGATTIEASAGGTTAQPAPQAPQDNATATAIAAAPIHTGSDNLPPLLASQMPGAAIAPPVGQTPSYASTPAPQPAPIVAAEPGRMGRDIGVEIARQVTAGRDEVTIRLSPAEMGRIDVRLSFDSKGALHAAVSADNPQALDMLRRDAGDLGRSLADAGIRNDSSSFSFESRDGNAHQFGQQQHGHPGGDGRPRHPGAPLRDADGSEQAAASPSPYRQLRASGRVDLMA